jgi:hypothetical protein
MAATVVAELVFDSGATWTVPVTSSVFESGAAPVSEIVIENGVYRVVG